MGGKTVRREPLILEVFDRAREILICVGWISYLTRFQPSNEEIAIEFLQHLQNGESMVKGRRITVIDTVIAEVSGLPEEGNIWSQKHILLQDAVETFKDEGEQVMQKGKGIQPSSLAETWKELASIIQRYITCDGRRDVVRPRQLKLLAVLKQKLTVNLPSLLNSLLHDTIFRIRWARHPKVVISHHGLIRLIISHSLVQYNLTWDGFMTTLESMQNTVIQHPAIAETSQQNPVPKRKRTTRSKVEPHKRKRSVRIELAQGCLQIFEMKATNLRRQLVQLG